MYVAMHYKDENYDTLRCPICKVRIPLRMTILVYYRRPIDNTVSVGTVDNHFFKSEVQFITTVVGAAIASSSEMVIKKRSPSPETT
jgi:hypothetical protein